MDADLAFALELADLADSITLPRFRALDLRVETKPDLTPVSDADRAAERALREHVARERNGDVVVGVVSAPALSRRWSAVRGGGASADGAAIAVSGVSSLGEAAVSCTFARDLAPLEPHVWHARGLGDFWQHMLVAEGSLDAAVDAKLAVWDYTAVALIVEEADGRASGLGEGRQFVTSNGRLHAPVLAALG